MSIDYDFWTEARLQAMDDVEIAVLDENWNFVRKICISNIDLASIILSEYDGLLPAEFMREIALFHYADHGDFYPVFLNVIRQSLPFRPVSWREDLPEVVRNLDVFTVYRAGAEDISKAEYSMSWTLSLDVALWFAARHFHYAHKPQHIFKGTISADKVIAYLGDRSEFEIVQYRNVKNITELPLAEPNAEFMEIRTRDAALPLGQQNDGSEDVKCFERWYREQTAKNAE